VKCLVDVNDEALLIEGLKALSGNVNPPAFKMIVELRRSLLDHLSAVYPASVIHSDPIDDSAAASVVAVVKTASTVSRMFPQFRKAVGSARHGKVQLSSQCVTWLAIAHN